MFRKKLMKPLLLVCMGAMLLTGVTGCGNSSDGTSNSKTGKGEESDKKGSLFEKEDPDAEGRLTLADGDLSYTDYPDYNAKGEYAGNLRVYTNHTDRDIELLITNEGNETPLPMFLPAGGTTCRYFGNAVKLGITDVAGFKIVEVPYAYAGGEAHDAAEEYKLMLWKTRSSLEMTIEYVGNDTEPFDCMGNYYVVFYDADGQVLCVNHVTYTDFRNTKKGDRTAGFSTFFRWADKTYDHVEVFYQPGVKFYNATDYKDAITMSELAVYKRSNTELEALLAVKNTTDEPLSGSFSIIGYDKEGNVAATAAVVDTLVLEAGADTYITERMSLWQGYDSADCIDHLEFRLNYVSRVEKDSKLYYYDLTDKLTWGAPEKDPYINSWHIDMKNNADEQADVRGCFLFYDAAGNLIGGKSSRTSLKAGEDTEFRVLPDEELVGDADHCECFIRATKSH
ncbi:MAG: hypothetical protein MJ064_06850 [Lachnospiraceae bacterium]|nr:hypothetical protein [Lachnospiraceae bacterium]